MKSTKRPAYTADQNPCRAIPNANVRLRGLWRIHGVWAWHFSSSRLSAKGNGPNIGSFHQPTLVIADPATFRTLPKREFSEGIAEIIKNAVIRDAAMLVDL
jgi:3-dehydroquinate synthase